MGKCFGKQNYAHKPRTRATSEFARYEAVPSSPDVDDELLHAGVRNLILPTLLCHNLDRWEMSAKSRGDVKNKAEASNAGGDHAAVLLDSLLEEEEISFTAGPVHGAVGTDYTATIVRIQKPNAEGMTHLLRYTYPGCKTLEWVRIDETIGMIIGKESPRWKKPVPYTKATVFAKALSRVWAALDHFRERLGRTRTKSFGVFHKRALSFMDIFTDALLVIDNATHLNNAFIIVSFDPDVHMRWAVVGVFIIVLPFLIEYAAMWQAGVATLTRRRCPLPQMTYALLGLPAMVLIKAYLLIVNPCSEAGYTTLSFFGAFEQLDFIAEACFEAPLQSLSSLCMAIQKMQVKGAAFPTTAVASLATSLLSLVSAYNQVATCQNEFGFWDQTRARGKGEWVTPSKWVTLTRIFRAAMTEEYMCICETFDEAKYMELCDCLQPPSCLCVLQVDMGLEDVTLLGKALEVNVSLQTLNLRGNKVEDVRPLGDALRVNKTLKELKVSFNQIKDCSGLAEGLRVNGSLIELRLINNRIVSVGPLVEALKVNSTLQILKLQGNPINDLSTLRNAKANGLRCEICADGL